LAPLAASLGPPLAAAARVLAQHMTYTPPPPPPESPVPTQETEDSYTSVDPTLSAPSWRDEDSWSAQPADDDSRWRNANAPAPPSASDPYGRGGAASSDIAACERSLGRALRGERARTLLGSIFDSGCTALKGSKEDPAPCARCRSCPSEGMWQHMRGYYNPQKRRVTLCADKRLDEKEVEDTLVHELVHAHDRCRPARPLLDPPRTLPAGPRIRPLPLLDARADGRQAAPVGSQVRRVGLLRGAGLPARRRVARARRALPPLLWVELLRRAARRRRRRRERLHRACGGRAARRGALGRTTVSTALRHVRRRKARPARRARLGLLRVPRRHRPLQARRAPAAHGADARRGGRGGEVSRAAPQDSC